MDSRSDPLVPSEKKVEIGHYVLSHTLGEGSSGKVKLAVNKETGEEVAIKIIPKSEFLQSPDLKIKVQREISLMKIVNNPGILKLIDVLESQRHLYIVMEYAEQGELFDYLVSHNHLEPSVAIEFFRQIVCTVEYLHSLGICHRDLKPENILLDSCTRIKLADFGFARWVKSNLTETACGSPHYAAPEIIKGHPYDGKIADIWSIGGYLPFDDTSVRSLLLKVIKGHFDMPPFPASIQDLIRKMLIVDPAKRITIEGIKAHPAFRIGIDPLYIVPTPVPFPKFSPAIDPSTLSHEVLDILSHIGFSDDELETQLKSPDFTTAKVFLSMINRTLDLESLPWEQAFSGPPQPTIDKTIPVDKNIIDSNANKLKTKTIGPFSKGRRKMVPVSSYEMYSVANRPEWALGEAPVTEVLREMKIDINGRSTWKIFATIQNKLGDMQHQWFHPDPMTMYVRSNSGSLYLSLVGKYFSPKDVKLTALLHNGDNKEFTELVSNLFEEVSNLEIEL
ncbi:CAMK family protein kinase [Histomonas meleagridis]|uniref:CAMK family protein kinase n=1 Tax=Histomonas meleagridis TaxID=135588 RepID=UPI00355A6A69|nr:CAMK family protein kinase [Histomonas meleagridis]KAH0798681.1 CAMK family protein kinase [Histomonas meleagridis]